jgi:chromatin remodeling complex protein RSC6
MSTTKAPKQTKTTTKATKKDVDAPAPVAETPKVVEAPAPAVSSPENEVVSISAESPSSLCEHFARVNKLQQELTALTSQLKSETKLLEKLVSREMKTLDKMNARKKKNQKGRAKSGFVKPTKISNELADFLGLAHGTEIARTDVTKQITQYVRDNKLQDKANGRRINADAKLKKLLNYDEKKVTDEKQLLSYFNLQRYLTVHFAKAQPATA